MEVKIYYKNSEVNLYKLEHEYAVGLLRALDRLEAEEEVEFIYLSDSKVIRVSDIDFIDVQDPKEGCMQPQVEGYYDVSFNFMGGNDITYENVSPSKVEEIRELISKEVGFVSIGEDLINLATVTYIEFNEEEDERSVQ